MTKARNLADNALTTVSPTELGYLDGVTSAVQTQLDAKIANTLTTTTGDIIYASAANTPARLGIGSTNQVLTVTGGLPVWGAAGGGSSALVVPTVDNTSVGPTTASFNSAYTSTAVGDLVYLTSSGTWQKTNATTSSATSYGMLGIAMSVAATGAAVTVALEGSLIYASTPFTGLTPGAILYMSGTAGLITTTAPTAASTVTRIVGYAIHANKIFFSPSTDWLTHL